MVAIKDRQGASVGRPIAGSRRQRRQVLSRPLFPRATNSQAFHVVWEIARNPQQIPGAAVDHDAVAFTAVRTGAAQDLGSSGHLVEGEDEEEGEEEGRRPSKGSKHHCRHEAVHVGGGVSTQGQEKRMSDSCDHRAQVTILLGRGTLGLLTPRSKPAGER